MKRQIRLYITVLLLTCAFSAAAAENTPMKVGFISAGSRESQFWSEMARFAQAVAEDLNIEFIVEFPQQSTYTIRRKGLRLLTKLDAGNYLISSYVGTVTGDLMNKARLKNMYVFIVNTNILSEEKSRLGRPRTRNPYWLAHSYADDEQAGYLVADELVRTVKPNPEQETAVKIVGISGSDTSQATDDRNKGLSNRAGEGINIQILEIDPGHWEYDSALTVANKLIAKHPIIDAIWSASDTMALAAVSALKGAGLRPGEDILVGGIDWTQSGLEAVKSGEMAATVGGHFMEVGIALILLYDFHHGLDFVDDPGIEFTIPMYAINKDNIDEYLTYIGNAPDWSKIDFKLFSKVHNKNLKKYDFSWKSIVKQMK